MDDRSDSAMLDSRPSGPLIQDPSGVYSFGSGTLSPPPQPHAPHPHCCALFSSYVLLQSSVLTPGVAIQEICRICTSSPLAASHTSWGGEPTFGWGSDLITQLYTQSPPHIELVSPHVAHLLACSHAHSLSHPPTLTVPHARPSLHPPTRQIIHSFVHSRSSGPCCHGLPCSLQADLRSLHVCSRSLRMLLGKARHDVLPFPCTTACHTCIDIPCWIYMFTSHDRVLIVCVQPQLYVSLCLQLTQLAMLQVRMRDPLQVSQVMQLGRQMQCRMQAPTPDPGPSPALLM